MPGDDKLLHWCHGSPGFILTLCLAAHFFQDPKYLQAAVRA
eukprot:CAMPEP_0201285492 /NCGR_PEP_ID=MMETSP1317-20130820/109385_1 /ASSEMBLY_ACC=CAM_ASM_000770 /TAXON_ID=187299 /ORGANISM="Undescribed Undescribed, Strain Undescribed" /LENGTH=40 /DNA_ID= /DNA_START= /DNA_END= /DNA_ORIENTATION=